MDQLDTRQLESTKGIFVGLGELARITGRSARTLRRWWADGKIPEPVIVNPPTWHRDQFTAENLVKWRKQQRREHGY